MTTKVPSALIDDDAVTHAKVAAGAMVQLVATTSAALVTGTTVVPNDNTIPQNTEGVEIPALDTAITPKSATNKLVIEAIINVANSATNQNIIAALFKDTDADAFAVAAETHTVGAEYVTMRVKAIVTAGSTTARTYKARVGGSAAGTTTINGQAGAATMGGVLLSSLTVTEIKA